LIRAAPSPLAATDYASFKNLLSKSQCNLCPALCGQRTNIVVDRGNPRARIMVIGEAPGETEDLRGEAFVGRAGQLLDRMLAYAGLDPSQDVLIANVVKCRPPNNRPPTAQEAENCKPYLRWQIEHVRPAVVLLLGATAARHLLPTMEGPMRDKVGRFFEIPAYPGVFFQLLYHPAYLLRDPRKKADVRVHLDALRERLSGLGLNPGPARKDGF
jgi:uracil-DNA glycosylase